MEQKAIVLPTKEQQLLALLEKKHLLHKENLAMVRQLQGLLPTFRQKGSPAGEILELREVIARRTALLEQLLAIETQVKPLEELWRSGKLRHTESMAIARTLSVEIQKLVEQTLQEDRAVSEAVAQRNASAFVVQ